VIVDGAENFPTRSLRNDASGWHPIGLSFIENISGTADASGSAVLFAATQGHDLFLFDPAHGLLQNTGLRFIGSLSAVTDRVIGKPATPALQWSPDSTKFVTYRLDERKVRDMHLLQSVPTDGSARPSASEVGMSPDLKRARRMLSICSATARSSTNASGGIDAPRPPCPADAAGVAPATRGSRAPG